jgi:hypothetical protein
MGAARRCAFTMIIDPFASDTGYWTFAECPGTVQPTLEMERGVEYTFNQNHPSNWMHPVAFAYHPDASFHGKDMLAPDVTQTQCPCPFTKSCQAPRYFMGSKDLSKKATLDLNYGRKAYEDAFRSRHAAWFAGRNSHGTDGYRVKLTLFETGGSKDIFYFCAVLLGVSGRIKQVDGPGGAQLHLADEPELFSRQVVSE